MEPRASLPFWAAVSPSVQWGWGRRTERADDFQGPFWLLTDLSDPPPQCLPQTQPAKQGTRKPEQSLLSREVGGPSDNTGGGPLPTMEGLGRTLFTQLASCRGGSGLCESTSKCHSYSPPLPKIRKSTHPALWQGLSRRPGVGSLRTWPFGAGFEGGIESEERRC